MSQVLQDLLSLLELETIEEGLYRGQSQDLGFAALFGGQVMGQALSAAKKTLPEERLVHSLHSYFCVLVTRINRSCMTSKRFATAKVSPRVGLKRFKTVSRSFI